MHQMLTFSEMIPLVILMVPQRVWNALSKIISRQNIICAGVASTTV